QVAVLGHGALGDHHDRRVGGLEAGGHPGADLVDVEGLLGDEDDVGAAGQSGVQGDPSGVTAHHLHDQDPHVGLGGGVQPVDGLGGDVDGGVEAEGVVGGGQVVVDGLGDAHAGDAVLLGEECGHSEGVLAADGDEGVDLPPPQGVLDAADAVLLVQRVGAGGAEDGAAAGQDAADGRYAEGDGAVLQRAPPAVPEAGEGVAVL